jgi:hypothetical protein
VAVPGDPPVLESTGTCESLGVASNFTKGELLIEKDIINIP